MLWGSIRRISALIPNTLCRRLAIRLRSSHHASDLVGVVVLTNFDLNFEGVQIVHPIDNQAVVGLEFGQFQYDAFHL